MKEILNKTNESYGRECFDEAINMCLDFKLDNKVNEKIFNRQEASKLYELPVNESTTMDTINDFKNNVLPYCTNFSSNKFMGFPDAGNSIPGITGAVISDFLQQNLINSSFCAPVATFTEIAVIKWLREIIGYKVGKIDNIWDVGGIITYGGTGSNATAMLLARENHRKNTMEKGVVTPDEYKVLIPKGIGHYSIKSSLMWLGCGDNIVEVETDNFRYDLNDLKKKLSENEGKVMAVVVYAGDSRTMTIENLKEVHDIVKSFDKNIWLHVDGCHGFSLAFSKKLRKRIEGIELYDSISTDPHKVLCIPYCISALLVKNPESLKLITSTSDLIMQEDFAFGQVTPFIGSKSWVSLKLWFSIKTLGIDGYAKIIERRVENAEYLKDLVEESKEFVLLNDVNINSVVFMYVEDKDKLKEKTVEELNKINLDIYNKLLEKGDYYLHKFTIPDNKGVVSKDSVLIPLRYMSGNDNLTKEDLKEMLSYIINVAKEVTNE